MNKNDVFKLVLAVSAVELAGIIGALFTAPSIPAWYADLAKPVLTPPAWIFAPVWTALFALMGIAIFLVLKKGWERKEVKTAFWVFVFQLLLNVLWSVVFFGARDPGAAFVEIIFLWAAIAATIAAFAKISRPAAWLLVPYILWVTFAAYLNYSVWQLL